MKATIELDLDDSDLSSAYPDGFDFFDAVESIAARVKEAGYFGPTNVPVRGAIDSIRFEESGQVSEETRRFLAQNDVAAATLATDEVAEFAQFYAGDLYVLRDDAGADDQFGVKLHDDWGGDEGKVVVHVYHYEDPDTDAVALFDTGAEAFVRFREIATGRLDVEARVEQAKKEILADSGADRFSGTIESFSDLYDYVDANEYGGLCEEIVSARFFPTLIEQANAIQDALDVWIREGGLV